jgi:crossover junction endodeoxyribonuclease RuvC
MLILGIDPGYERLGIGLVRREGSRLSCEYSGMIQTPRILMPDRLRIIHEELTELLTLHKPDAVATERQLFAANKTTALDVAKALGVVLLCTSQQGLPWAEYTPPEIKLAVVGNGAADKKQVQFMVTKLLGLSAAPKPDDIADALAIAICHAMRTRINLTLNG